MQRGTLTSRKAIVAVLILQLIPLVLFPPESFSQGFNIISRLMMLWPHATKTVGGATVANMPYILLTFVAIGLSVFLLWYSELPEVRVGLLRG